MQFRAAIEEDACDLQALAAIATRASGHAGFAPDFNFDATDHQANERELEAAAMALRRRWLEVAHKPADTTLKSPCHGEIAHVPSGSAVSFGYERDIDASLLERRGSTYISAASGWHSEVVLFRSGQAALACLLQLAITHWGRRDALSVVHAGGYFETASLLKSWPQRVLRVLPTTCGAADIVIAEPVWCNGTFQCTDAIPPARRVLILDITMAGPTCDLTKVLKLTECPLVIAYSSGLKLDQAGLELANVGIVRVYARDDIDAPVSGLREIRSLVGASLTLDEMSALSAPWFMDRSYAGRYVGAIFVHNRALAASIGSSSPVFAPYCHPSLKRPDADAPFCALTLNEPSAEAYRALEARMTRECERRGLLITKGGSFGFRGHRFELIEPRPDQGSPFLRVALGWRGGWSSQGLCELFSDLAYPGR